MSVRFPFPQRAFIATIVELLFSVDDINAIELLTFRDLLRGSLLLPRHLLFELTLLFLLLIDLFNSDET